MIELLWTFFNMKCIIKRKERYQQISRKSETQSFRACKMAASCHVKDALSEKTMLFSFFLELKGN